MQWDAQKEHSQVRYLIPSLVKPDNEMHAEQANTRNAGANYNTNAPASPASVCLTDESSSVCPCPQQLQQGWLGGPIQFASTHSTNSSDSNLHITAIDGYKGSNMQQFMSIAPYNDQASRISTQEVSPGVSNRFSSPGLANSAGCGVLTGVIYEYTYVTAQRFIDMNGVSTSFVTLSGASASNKTQQSPAKAYIFKPISDAMHISNYDELLLDVSTDGASVNDQESPKNDDTTLFQVASPSIDAAISTSGATPALEDSALDSLMWSAYGDLTLLDAHSAYEFSELMKHAEPVVAPSTELYTPQRWYPREPYITSPTLDNRRTNPRAFATFATLTPTSLYMPTHFRNRSMNVPAEIRLKKRLFHSRRMIRIVASNRQIIGGSGNNCAGELNASRADSSIEAYQVLPVGVSADDYLSKDAFILYCQGGPYNSWDNQDLPQNNALSPFKSSLMSPLAPFAFNVPSDVGYKSVRVNRDAIQSPILKNDVLAATPKVVILPESSTNTHARRFLVTPIHSSTPRKDSGSGFKSLNYHALSSNEPSSERVMSDAISDQSYDSIFINTRNKTKFTKNSTGTPYNFSLERSRKDLRDIPLPPTLKKS